MLTLPDRIPIGQFFVYIAFRLPSGVLEHR